MSRYSKFIGGFEYAYGFDAPLQEYFFQKYDPKLATDDNDEGLAFSISSHMTDIPHPSTPDKYDYSNSQIMEIIKSEEKLIGQKIMDEEHWDAIGGDLPF